MSSGEFASNGGGHNHVPEDQPDQSNRVPDRSLLEDVLAETLSTSNQPIDPAELQSLQQVARRYPDQPISLEPIGVELVMAILQLRFPGARDSDTAWQRMSSTIAESMLDVPEIQRRLEKFWTKLSESVS